MAYIQSMTCCVDQALMCACESYAGCRDGESRGYDRSRGCVMVSSEKAVAARDDWNGVSLGSSGDICNEYPKSNSADTCEERNRCGPLGPDTGSIRNSMGGRLCVLVLGLGVRASSYEEMVVWLLRLLSYLGGVRGGTFRPSTRARNNRPDLPTQNCPWRRLLLLLHSRSHPRNQCRRSPSPPRPAKRVAWQPSWPRGMKQHPSYAGTSLLLPPPEA